MIGLRREREADTPLEGGRVPRRTPLTEGMRPDLDLVPADESRADPGLGECLEIPPGAPGRGMVGIVLLAERTPPQLIFEAPKSHCNVCMIVLSLLLRKAPGHRVPGAGQMGVRQSNDELLGPPSESVELKVDLPGPLEVERVVGVAEGFELSEDALQFAVSGLRIPFVHRLLGLRFAVPFS